METTTSPSLSELKSEAKALRQEMVAQGTPITQAQSLERVARWHGARDWNTLVARTRRRSPLPPIGVGERVQGFYMGKHFFGKVLGMDALDRKEAFQVTIQLDAPVDVVTFDSFENRRQRVTSTVGRDGLSAARRSDGTPHLRLLL